MTDRSRLTTLAAITLGVWASAVSPAQAQPRHPYDNRHSAHRPPSHRPPPPPPPRHHRPPPYAVGGRLPHQYLGYNHRIERWHQYHLPRPRPGAYWVQYGGEYMMVTPSGVVLQIWGR